MTTLAGNFPGSSSDGIGPAARFFRPYAVAVDAIGNLYIADTNNHTIRKVTPTGEVTTLAGLAGVYGSADGIGSAARFFHPIGIAVDGFGNLYVADHLNNTIRKVTPSGLVTTLAGLAGSRGRVDGTGTAARFSGPFGVALDVAGTLYVADKFNAAIRKVTAEGAVTTLSLNADLAAWLVAAAVDGSGNVYVTDDRTFTIRKLTPSGEVTTLAGSPGNQGSTDGTGSLARFKVPAGIALDTSGNLYVADSGNLTIRKVSPAGEVTTVAGLAGSPGDSNGVGSAARFRNPWGIALDGSGNAYVTDIESATVRKLTPAGEVTTLAGRPAFGAADGAGLAAQFKSPSGMAWDGLGNLYVADAGNHTIRKVTAAGQVSTLAGLAEACGSVDGTGPAARFCLAPLTGIAVDGSGSVYVTDGNNHTIRKVSPAGVVSTLAGSLGMSGSADGIPGRFLFPTGIAVEPGGSAYVTDQNQTIRRVSISSVVTTVAGLAGGRGSADGTGSVARFDQPTGVGLDGSGNVFIADTSNRTLRRMTPAAEVTTLAGLAHQAPGSADGTGTAARFAFPAGVAATSSGTLYVTDRTDHTIRKVTPAGVVTTLAGVAGVAGLADGLGSAARFNLPTGIAVDDVGNLYVADAGSHSIRKLSPEFTLTVARSGAPAGTVTSSVAGIACGTDCTEEYHAGTQVTLTAAATSQFDGWSGGGCSGTGLCTVTMDAAKSVTASFSWRAPSASVCASGCTRTTIQAALDASAPGDTVLVRSTYDSIAAGEVFPVTTQAIRAIDPAGVIRILGELDGSGTPTTTVKTRAAPADGILMLSPGAVENLKIIPGDSTRVDRVITARSGNACPGPSCNLKGGLSIRNLAVDFSPASNAGNGLDLRADDVLVEKVTLKGIAGTSILLDGSNGRIQNNTITDFAGKGIEVSGSQGTQIMSNVLTEVQTGAVYGIGLSSNGFQTCTGNKIALNKVLGRSARDLTRGISVASCADTEIILNEVREFSNNAIEVSMSPGQSTRTVIQGNTVIGGNAAGIVYTGADSSGSAVDRSIIRDNVVTDQGRDGILVQFIKGSRSGVGAGNVVAYNTVRKVNQGDFPNAHGISLQSLSGTAFDRNTALGTRGEAGVRGYGFFIADSAGVTGTCNTGAANAGGLFRQVNVTPAYGNVNINCRLALYTHNDFDGDGRSDATLYRHTTGEWFVRHSSGAADATVGWGSPALDDIPAPGSYTQAGKTDMVYRFSTGDWIIRRSTDGGTTTIPFGDPSLGDLPVPADYDGDGLSDLATFRVSTANAEWRIRRSSDSLTQYFAWGCAACADLAVPADYDGDGKADIAVYRRATGEWYVSRSSDGSLLQVQWGSPELGDLPVAGRYTTASRADIAVYRSLSGQWLIRRSTDASLTEIVWGSPSEGDFPVPADYTANGLTDVAIYRPVAFRGAFLIRRSTDAGSTTITWGSPALLDAPLTSR